MAKRAVDSLRPQLALREQLSAVPPAFTTL